MKINFTGYKENISINLKEMVEIDSLVALEAYVSRKLSEENRCYLLVFNPQGVAYCADSTSIPHVSKILIDQYLQIGGSLRVKYFFPFPNPLECELLYSSERLPSTEEVKLLPVYPYETVMSYSSLEEEYCIKHGKDMISFSRWSVLEFVADECAVSTLAYIKYAPFRKANTRIRTVIEGAKIYKLPENESAQVHMADIYKIYVSMKEKNLPVLDMELQQGILEIPFVKGMKWDEYLVDCYLHRGEKCFLLELDKMRDFFYEISYKKPFESPFDLELAQLYPGGAKILTIALMDGIINNVMIICDRPFFFDQEWICPQEIPADYLIYLSLLHLSKLTPRLELDMLLKRYHISEAMQSVFLRIYNNFYFGEGDL